MNVDDGAVVVDGQPVRLTSLEFRLLCTLVRHRHRGRVLSSDQLLRLVWEDWSSISSDRVKFTVLRLRRKLGDRVSIESVRGFGYRYRPEQPVAPAR